MKLSNRFSENTQELFTWVYWECWECGISHANCSHHIISPSSEIYRKGNHNKSPLNLARLNNFECHIGQNIHTPEKESKYLKKTTKYLQGIGYRLTDADNEFLEMYKERYI